MFFFFVRLPISKFLHIVKNNVPNPIGKLLGIWYRSGKQDDVDMFWQHNDDFFPYDTSLIR